jgi:NADH/NAD ratio-sensing transcriptional regulator Rex
MHYCALNMQATARLAVTQRETARIQETLAAAGVQTAVNADDVQWDLETDVVLTSADVTAEHSAVHSAHALLQQHR